MPIDNPSVHGEDSEQIVNSAKTINQRQRSAINHGKGLQWSGMGNTKMLNFQGDPIDCGVQTQ